MVSVKINFGEIMRTLGFATLFSAMLAPAVSAESISVAVQYTTQNTTQTGTVRAALYADQAAFDADQAVAGTMSPAGDEHIMLTFEDVAPGRYGIAVFHDLNDNEELDSNIFGAPNEPFGFSNDPTIGFSAPKFEAFEFEFDGSKLELVINLNEV